MLETPKGSSQLFLINETLSKHRAVVSENHRNAHPIVTNQHIV